MIFKSIIPSISSKSIALPRIGSFLWKIACSQIPGQWECVVPQGATCAQFKQSDCALPLDAYCRSAVFSRPVHPFSSNQPDTAFMFYETRKRIRLDVQDPFDVYRENLSIKKTRYMSSYECFPGHEEIRLRMDRVSSSSSCSSSSSSDSSPTSVIEAPLPPIHSSAIHSDITISHFEGLVDSTLSPKADINHNDSTVSALYDFPN